MSILNQLNEKLMMQLNNITSDNPSAAELDAIEKQTKQIVAISKPIIDNCRLILDSTKLAYDMGHNAKIDNSVFGEVGHNGVREVANANP